MTEAIVIPDYIGGLVIKKLGWDVVEYWTSKRPVVFRLTKYKKSSYGREILEIRGIRKFKKYIKENL